MYVGVPRVKRQSKLDVWAKKRFLVGYALRMRGYRIRMPNNNKVIETINLKFDPNGTLFCSGAKLGQSDQSNNETAKNYEFLIDNLSHN